jgi:translation initiation factor 6 (eIF-6)
VLAPPSLTGDLFTEAQKALEVPVHRTTIGGTTIIGAPVAMNSTGVLVPDIVRKREVQALE